MNRRHFTTALSALFAAPALPLKALSAAPVAASTVPNAARFWAIYMSQLHGSCSASTLSTMTGIDATAAQGYLSRMITDGVIKPTNIISKAINAQANKSNRPSQWTERMQKFTQEKTQTAPAPDTEDVDPDTSAIVPVDDHLTEVSK